MMRKGWREKKHSYCGEGANGDVAHEYAPDRGASHSPPLPLYKQVKNYIEDRIGRGDWKPNMRIPSENQLVDMLGVSRMTANRAIRELSAEGHLVRLQGVGTFVAEHKPQCGFLEIKSISQEIKERGGVHSSTVHLLQEEEASHELALIMGISEGAAVYHSIIVHRDRGHPIQYAERYVNPVVAPDYLEQDFTRITPTEYLLRVAPLTEVEHIVEAILPDEHIRTLLEIGEEEPCLVLHRITWSKGIVATKNRFIYPGSRYRIGGRFRFSALDRYGIA